jgi:hypothetical protein
MYVLSLARCRLEWQGKDTHDPTTEKNRSSKETAKQALEI